MRSRPRPSRAVSGSVSSSRSSAAGALLSGFSSLQSSPGSSRPSSSPPAGRGCFFTYRIPIVPLIVVFDGIASVLRVCSPDELRELVAGMDAPHYEWDIGIAPILGQPANATWLIGTPYEADAANCGSRQEQLAPLP